MNCLIIRFIDKLNDEKLKKDIWDILCECDNEFYPPLSCRDIQYNGIKDTFDSNQAKPYEYFEQLIKQVFLVAINEEDDILMGFMGIKHSYSCDELNSYLPANYLTTLCVKNEFRRRGVAKNLYHKLQDNIPQQYKLPFIATRTWSTNHAHINCLADMNFELVTKIENHRGAGIHTFYYAKKVEL